MRLKACIFRSVTLRCRNLTAFSLFQRDTGKQDSGRCDPLLIYIWSLFSRKISGVSVPSCPTISLCHPHCQLQDVGLCQTLPGMPASAAVDGDIYQAVIELAQVFAKTCGNRRQTTSERTHAVRSSGSLHTHTHMCTYLLTHSGIFFHELLLLLRLSTDSALKYRCSVEST